MNLIEKANLIISQPLTDDDVTELQKIKREMSKLYDQAITIAWIQEADYNQTRSNKYISCKKEIKYDGKKYTESEMQMIAKDEAENKFGKRRTAKAKASWMKAKYEAIRDICVDYYTRQKNTRDASITT